MQGGKGRGVWVAFHLLKQVATSRAPKRRRGLAVRGCAVRLGVCVGGRADPWQSSLSRPPTSRAKKAAEVRKAGRRGKNTELGPEQPTEVGRGRAREGPSVN